MIPEEIEEKKKLYRQALSMVFSKGIADATKIMYFPQKYLDDIRIWVNVAFYLKSGILALSPTGWKSYTPEQFDAEIQSLFNQAKKTELKMSEVQRREK